MMEILVDSQEANTRLDSFCASKSPLSRTKISEMIKNGRILVNGSKSKPRTLLSENDVIVILEYIPKATDMSPMKMPLDIVFEDEYLLVVNKKRGIVVHPGKGTKDPTLLNGLIYYFQTLGLHHTPGLVHRIDKDTEGLLVVAKDSITHDALAKQLLDKTLHREYLAVCEGQTTFDEIAVTFPIGIDPVNPKRMAPHGIDSKTAETHFKTIERIKNYSIMQCTLKTGRTHQIRVHAAAMGHPLIGDPVYGIDSLAPGQALLAYKVSFIHPHTHKEVVIECPVDSLITYVSSIMKD